jgi:hypothetical protein
MSETELVPLLNHAMAHAGKSFFTMSQVRDIPALRKAWAIPPKALPPETAQKLRAMLPEGFMIRTGSKGYLYLERDIPLEVMLLHKMATQKNPIGPSALLTNLPMTKKEGVLAINALLASGRLACTLNDNYAVRFTLVADPPSVSSSDENIS